MWQRGVRVKQDNPIDAPIQGALLVFYPQGAIVKLNDTMLGVAHAQSVRPRSCHVRAGYTYGYVKKRRQHHEPAGDRQS